MSSNTSSINKILSIFQDLSIRHEMINDFFVGDASDISASRPLLFPYLWIGYAPVTISGPVNSAGQTITYQFRIAVMDKIKKGDSNYQDTMSDTQYILSTIISEMSQHAYYTDMNIKVEGNQVMEPAEQETDDNANGWVCTLVLKVPMRYTYCNSPILPISGWTSSLSNNITQYRLIGATGPQGWQGWQGPVSGGGTGSTGAQGPQGNEGTKGGIGNTGPQGFQGLQGPQGFQGNQGFIGATGISGGFAFDYLLEGGSDFVENELVLEGFDMSITTALRASNSDTYNNDVSSALNSIYISASQSASMFIRIYDLNDNSWSHYYSATTSNISMDTNDPGGMQINGLIYIGGSSDITYRNVDVGFSFTINGTEGIQGPQGVIGITGSQGPQGFQGNQGIMGNTGAQGNQGFQGLTGSMGGWTIPYFTRVVSGFATGQLSADVGSFSAITTLRASNTDDTGGDINDVGTIYDNLLAYPNLKIKIFGLTSSRAYFYNCATMSVQSAGASFSVIYTGGSALASPNVTNGEKFGLSFILPGSNGSQGFQGISGITGSQGPQGVAGSGGGSSTLTYSTITLGLTTSNSTTTGITASGSTMSISSTGIWDIQYAVQYDSDATTNGSNFTLESDDVVASYFWGVTSYNTGTGDASTSNFSSFGGGGTVVSSRATSNNMAMVSARLVVTTPGTVWLSFRSEAAGTITVKNTTKGLVTKHVDL